MDASTIEDFHAESLHVEAVNTDASTPTRAASTPVICRAIEDGDIAAIIDLLAEGFPERSRAYWSRGFARLRDRIAIADYPRYGYLIAADGVAVGCILLIVSQPVGATPQAPRGNVSSWYVRPAYRSLASMLVSKLFRAKEMTLVNISPASHTLPILHAQGYRSFACGQIVAYPTLRFLYGISVAAWRDGADDSALPPDELGLLRRHADYGCLVLIVRDGARREPFIFVRTRPVRGVVPAVQVVWCRDITAMARCAGAIGRHFLRHGIFAVVIDANGPLEGLSGLYRPGRAQKFFRGPKPPRLGDITDTELTIFGV